MLNPPKSPSRQRGRPSISDAQRREMRAQIAKTAKALFQEEGYGKISIRRIAAEIGCSPMTLYKYYDAKIDILRTLWADVFKDVFKLMDAPNLESATAKERLRLLSNIYVGYWLANTEHYRLVFMVEGVTQPDVSLFLDNPELIERFQIFATAIAAASDTALTSDAIKQKLDALICFLHGIAHNLITISGYQWSASEELISVAVRGVLSDSND